MSRFKITRNILNMRGRCQLLHLTPPPFVCGISPCLFAPISVMSSDEPSSVPVFTFASSSTWADVRGGLQRPGGPSSEGGVGPRSSLLGLDKLAAQKRHEAATRLTHLNEDDADSLPPSASITSDGFTKPVARAIGGAKPLRRKQADDDLPLHVPAHSSASHAAFGGSGLPSAGPNGSARDAPRAESASGSSRETDRGGQGSHHRPRDLLHPRDSRDSREARESRDHRDSRDPRWDSRDRDRNRSRDSSSAGSSGDSRSSGDDVRGDHRPTASTHSHPSFTPSLLASGRSIETPMHPSVHPERQALRERPTSSRWEGSAGAATPRPDASPWSTPRDRASSSTAATPSFSSTPATPQWSQDVTSCTLLFLLDLCWWC